MAGDWIKMQGNLWTSPKVVRIMSACNADKCPVIGALFRVWSIFDEHTEDGLLRGYTKNILDDELKMPGFCDAMEAADWLVVTDDGLQVPDFNHHMSKSAKRRAQDTQRKKTVRNVSASEADKNRTREEKRREEKDIVEKAINHLNDQSGKNYKPVESNAKLIRGRLAEGHTLDDIKTVITEKCAEWKGDANMEKYLRPATIFGAEKFNQYIGQVGCGGVKRMKW